MADRSLKEAIERGDVNLVDELLSDIDLNIFEYYEGDMTPLFLALKLDYERECKELADAYNLDVDDVIDGRVKVTFSYRDDPITLSLVEAGCRLYDKDPCDRTPLMVALDYRRGYKTIRMLVEYGSELNGLSWFQDDTVLFRAVNNDYNTEMIIYLINQGASIYHVDDSFYTVLYHAVRKNDLEIVKVLVDAGAYVSHGGPEHPSCEIFEQITCQNCNEVDCKSKGIIDILCKIGADLKGIDIYDDSVIHNASCNYLIRLCVRSGVSIDVKGSKGFTPLMKAIRENDIDKVNSLLSLFGADCTSIFYNSFRNVWNRCKDILYSQGIVSLLFYHGADLWARNDVNQTILDVVFSVQGDVDYLCCKATAIEEFIKHSLLFMDEKLLNNSFRDHQDNETRRKYFLFFKDCQDELIKLKNVYLRDGLTFFEFCNLKRLDKSEIVDIPVDKYNYNIHETKKMFPIFNDLIIMRIKDIHVKRRKRVLMRSLENIVVKPLPPINEIDSEVRLNYDCFHYVCRDFNCQDLHNLFLASIEP